MHNLDKQKTAQIRKTLLPIAADRHFGRQKAIRFMTIEQLHNKLADLKVPADNYYLHGLYGSTDDNDKIALTIKIGKRTLEYEVYFKERGQKNSSTIFYSEDEACDYILKRLTDMKKYLP